MSFFVIAERGGGSYLSGHLPLRGKNKRPCRLQASLTRSAGVFAMFVALGEAQMSAVPTKQTRRQARGACQRTHERRLQLSADICPCGTKRIASVLVSKLPRLTAILAPTRVCYAHALWSIPAAKAGRKRKTTSNEVVFFFW